MKFSIYLFQLSGIYLKDKIQTKCYLVIYSKSTLSIHQLFFNVIYILYQSCLDFLFIVLSFPKIQNSRESRNLIPAKIFKHDHIVSRQKIRERASLIQKLINKKHKMSSDLTPTRPSRHSCNSRNLLQLKIDSRSLLSQGHVSRE